eukprot:gene440-700_t
MNQIFSDLIGKCVFVYLDDILVFSATPEEHMQHLEAVLNRLQQHKLYCRLHKCHFGLPNVEYLSHIVGENGIRVDPRKVKIVQDWPAPKTQSELRGFLGLTNYFRRFIHAYSSITRPLHALTGSVKWHPSLWSAACQSAFDLLKEKLTHAPVLAMPDFEKPFEIVADASNTAVGATLLQDGKPIAFESRKLTPAEVAYDTMEREMTAVIHALTVWRPYVDQAEITVFSDHEPLRYLRTKPTLTPRQIRWSQFMERFNYKWEFRAGRLNAADPLSRAPHSADGSGMGNITGRPLGPDDYQLAAVSRDRTSKRKRSFPVIYPPPPPLPTEQRADWIDLIKMSYPSDPPLAKLQRRGKIGIQKEIQLGQWTVHADIKGKRPSSASRTEAMRAQLQWMMMSVELALPFNVQATISDRMPKIFKDSTIAR